MLVRVMCRHKPVDSHKVFVSHRQTAVMGSDQQHPQGVHPRHGPGPRLDSEQKPDLVTETLVQICGAVAAMGGVTRDRGWRPVRSLRASEVSRAITGV